MTPEDAIVAALSTVAGLTPTPVEPASKVAGCAWPAFSRHGKLRNQCLTEVTFYVYAVMPPGPQAAVTASEIRLQIAQALAAAGQVQAGEAWSIPVEAGGQTVPGIRYTVEV